ncbi:DUF4188 domain-containing protein [Streptomyces hundungensis]|uniref:DUF4188 domain-containing protein n=1 Tax=Streptomyces hundungensis TaxID=1077946 RepID=UPI0033D82AB6
MSAKQAPNRTTAAAEGEVVVLLIGMRVNHFWAVHQWVPVGLAMLRMLAELKRDRSRGLLGHVLLTASPRTYYVVQYWESKEKLYAYAHSPQMFHHRAWAILNRKERQPGPCGNHPSPCPHGVCLNKCAQRELTGTGNSAVRQIRR